jgi:hypothetical protein
MGFRDLFKVRRPGNGDAVQASFARASKESKARKFPSQDNSQTSGGKKPVK